MARNAGFAMVANVTQGVLNEIIAAYWSDLPQPLTFSLPATQVAGETVSFQGELEILPVTLSLAARSDHLITTTLSCGGYLSAQVGTTAASAVLSLSATFDVGVTVASTSGYLVPSLDLSNVVVVALDIAVVQGPPLPATVNQALNEPAVLGTVQSALRAIPTNLLALGNSIIPAQFSANGVTANLGNVTIIPQPGYLALAADLLGYSTGNASQLVNLFSPPAPTPIIVENNQDGSQTVTGGGIGNPGYACNVAATINGPVLLAFLNGPVAQAIANYPLPDDASISSVNFDFTSYQLPLDDRWWPGIVVTVNVDEVILSGSITVDFAVRLIQAGSGTTGWLVAQPPPAWEFRADNVIISTSFIDDVLAAAAAFVVNLVVPPLGPIIFAALAVVLEGVIPDLITSFETEAQNAINAGIESGSSFGSALPYQNVSSLPGTSSANWSAEIQAIAVSPAGFDSFCVASAGATNGGNPTLSFAGGTLTEAAEATYFYTAAPQNWKLTVKIPANNALSQFPDFLNQTDPTIHVGWSVSGTNIDGASVSSDAPITSAGSLVKSIDFNPDNPQFVHNNGLTITVTIYRLIAGTQYKLWTSTVTATIFDELDITYNYAQWNHLVYFSAQSNVGTPRFEWYRKRKSVIHKTDRTRRCKNVTAAAIAAQRKDRELTYFNDLPFPESEAASHRRGVVCDYCFYGGPHGTHFTR
jgi:hypothetical protein